MLIVLIVDDRDLTRQHSQTLAIDLVNPSYEAEKRKHKLKRLVQSPNSYFMDVKCPGAITISRLSLSMF